MKSVQKFHIALEDGKKPHFPGEFVQGHVYLVLAKEVKLRSLKVSFIGEARAVWRKGSIDRRRVDQNKEEIFLLSTTLLGKELSGSNVVLGSGEHVLPFSFQIPDRNLPSSYEGLFGFVRYTMKAVINRPWKFDLSSKTALTVLEVVDVNKQDFLKPITMEEEYFHGCMCRSGPLSVTVKTDRGGFCPGEAVAINSNIVNSLSGSSGKFKIQLVQTSNFRSRHGEQRSKRCAVQSMNKEGVPGHSVRQWKNLLFPIPSVVPTMSASSCIKVSYTLEISAKKKIFLQSPIIIGSIPYHRAVSPSAPPLQEEASPQPSAPPDYGSMAPAHDLPEFPPPSYQESVQGSATIRDALDGSHMMGDTSFTPMYPYVSNYRFNELPAYSVLPERRRSDSQDSNASTDSMNPPLGYEL